MTTTPTSSAPTTPGNWVPNGHYKWWPWWPSGTGTGWTATESHVYISNEHLDGTCDCQDKGSFYFLSPIIVDVFNIGYPDLMAGPNAWPNGRAVTPLVSSNTIPFDLMGGVWIATEWVGPNTGILVYGEKGVPPIGRINGFNLFGQRFKGDVYKNGYEALATLDVHKKGVLEGDDLKEIFVWLDKNGDGVIQAGEIKPASYFFESISVKNAGTDDVTWNQEGALTRYGTTVATWDWWAQSQDAVAETASNKDVSVYSWKSIESGFSGYFRFCRADGELYIISVDVSQKLDAGFECFVSKVVEKDGVYSWVFGALPSSYSNATLEDGLLIGNTSMSGRGEYSWKASLLTKESAVIRDPAVQAIMAYDEQWILKDRNRYYNRFVIPRSNQAKPINFVPLSEFRASVFKPAKSIITK